MLSAYISVKNDRCSFWSACLSVQNNYDKTAVGILVGVHRMVAVGDISQNDFS